MRTTWVAMAVLLLVGGGTGTAAAGNGPQLGANGAAVQPAPQPSDPAHQPSGPAEVDASSVMLPCVPVAAYWTGPPQAEGMPPGPELAIVSIDARPKDARVHLDDRFVGRARYLDGRPGYLYLTPGLYRLELRLDGYQTVVVNLEAQAGCRFDLKHRLQRIPGTAKEDKAENFGKGEPFNRVFAPLLPGVQPGGAVKNGGADPGLRPDIAATGRSGGEKLPQGAALKLTVSPDEASVAIDGGFVATARELSRMVGALAVTSGSHRIEISAPGFLTVTRDLELADGEVLELTVDLEINRNGPE